MPFYTGKSVDGSDMREIEGMYISPYNNNIWSSDPYPGQQKVINTKNEVLDYMNAKYTLDDVKIQIENKTCPLSKRLRDYVLSHYDTNGNFIKQY